MPPEDDITPVAVEIIAEVNATEAEAEAAFGAGFAGESVAPKEAPVVSPPVVEPVVAEAVPVDVVVPVEIVPKAATVSEEQLADLLLKAKTVEQVQSAMEKFRGDAFGKIGGLERTLKAIQDATPAGKAIDVKGEDFEELQKAYPDVAAKLASGLTKVLSQFKGTAAPAVDPVDFDTRIAPIVDARVEARVAAVQTELLKKFERERLTDKYPNWPTLIGPANSTTPFRGWLDTQPAEYKAMVLSSNVASEIGGAIDLFQTSLKKPDEKKPAPKGQDARSRQLAEAIPAKGGAGPAVKQEKTVEQAFEEGFAGRTS